MCYINSIERKAVTETANVVYDEPERYRKEDKEIELKECPAYDKPCAEVDVKLEDCPAYVEQGKDVSIRLEECPAYGESRRGLNITLDPCPTYQHIT